MKFITLLLVVLSTLLSTYLTVSFGMSLGLASSAFTVVCIGLVWEIAKYTFTHQGAVLIRRMNMRDAITGGVYLALAAVLIAGSICASIAGAESIRAKEERVLAEELAHVTGVQQKVELVSALTASGQDDIRNGYRGRGNATLIQAMDLQAEIDTTTSTAAASALPVVGDTAWWVAICVVAVMLDLIGVAGIHLLSTYRRSSVAVIREQNHHASNHADVSPKTDNTSGISKKVGHDIHAIAKRVVNREIEPGYAALARAGISQKTAKKVLQLCVEDGAIRHEHRKFVYT
jgi:hypothetical protein